MRQMTEKDYIELERKQRDRTVKTEAAFKACTELVKIYSNPRTFKERQASPLYPAYTHARRALGMEDDK